MDSAAASDGSRPDSGLANMDSGAVMADSGGADSGFAGMDSAAVIDGGGADVDSAAVIDGGESARDGGGSTDAPVATDAGRDDGALLDAAGAPPCTGSMFGTCPVGTMCLACPTGPISQTYLCTTPCTLDADCRDPSRPICSRDRREGAPGICTPPDLVCVWGVRCASPDTMIATPYGERPISELQEGDLVWSAGAGAMRVVPLRMVSRTPALEHRIVRVVLSTGRVLEISPGHPTADGRTFADLRAGDVLDGIPIVSLEIAPYLHPFTYDVLPDSETGTYVAGGALIGSTLLGL